MKANSVAGILDDVMQPMPLNNETHLVLTIDEGGGAGGNTLVKVYSESALVGSFETTAKLSDIAAQQNWIGRSRIQRKKWLMRATTSFVSIARAECC